ncbi:DNA helicase RecQ [candidate division KSB1 bacterium]|nr:DNA helicase RecQ [candidate division KSB1 bacterium]
MHARIGTDLPQTPQNILKSVFGYEAFRPLQQEIIDNLLQKRDTMVIMPTGGGKSLCYQIPALLFDGLTVVVSPLISLMKDQVEQLQQLGVAAAFLNSSLSPAEFKATVKQVTDGKLKLLYMAPEGLLTDRTLEMLHTQTLSCLTIDEAHCISEWGHDFRPEYRRLVRVRKAFPGAVLIALTATATPRVQKDIVETLEFESTNAFIASFNRENLFMEIVAKTDPATQLLDFLDRHKEQSGIIYCFSRRQVDSLAGYLAALGHSVLPYHAGLEDGVRKSNQDQFIRDDVQIMIATIAFGMGINKPNVRFVVHYDLPKNIESYYQEIGRAGRDGLRADCLLLFGYGDLQKIRYFIDQKENTQEQRAARMHLQALVDLAESHQCRRIPLLRYFGETYTRENCAMCDNCLRGEQPTQDVTVAAQKLLSCIKRTREMFGANHIIDILRGSENKKIIDFGHQRLSTYGIGVEYSRDQWLQIIRQLISQGVLNKAPEYGSLKLTAAGIEVLFGRQKAHVVLQQEPPRQPMQLELEYDRVLFEQLRQKRKQLADQQLIPPYAVFPDRTLIEMAKYFPQSEDRLRSLHGIGHVKLEKYGRIFLMLIRNYCREKGIAEVPFITTSLKKKTPGMLRHVQVGSAFAAGHSIEALQRQFNIKKSTIVAHLYRYLQEGLSLTAKQIRDEIHLNEKEVADVIACFDLHGAEYLTPVFEDLGRRIPYETLHLLRIYYLLQDRNET